MASPLSNHEVMILLWTKPLSQSKNMQKKNENFKKISREKSQARHR